MSLNKVMLIGRVGKDPEVMQTKTGKTVAKFSFVTSEYYQENGERKERATWHNVICWDKIAETVSKYVTKGKELYLEGKISNRSYEQDKITKWISEVVVSSLVFVGSKSTTSSAGDNNAPEEKSAAPSKPASQPSKKSEPEPEPEYVHNSGGDDLPF